jgi:hypothetical protein
MDKSDWIELHKNMIPIKNALVRQIGDYSAFEEYESLDIRPSHGHKSGSEHKQAVFVLGSALAETMSEDEFSDAQRIADRLKGLEEKFDDES